MDKKSQVQIAYSKLTNEGQNNFTRFVKISFLIFVVVVVVYLFIYYFFYRLFFFFFENLNVQKAKSSFFFGVIFMFFLLICRTVSYVIPPQNQLVIRKIYTEIFYYIQYHAMKICFWSSCMKSNFGPPTLSLFCLY